MVLELGLVGCHGFESPLYNLNICSPFVLCILKFIKDLCLFASPRAGMGPHVSESVKE